MPYLRIQTNVEVDDETAILKSASALVAKEVGKPEKYVMVSFGNDRFVFDGTEEPCVFFELKSIDLSESRTEKLSIALCSFADQYLRIKPDRVYINFVSFKGSMWGWNGSTF